MATLLIAANLPDLDAVAAFTEQGLAIRRGITHGLPALILLPLFAALKSRTGQRVTGFIARLSARPGVIFLWVLPGVLLIILGDPYGLMGPAPNEGSSRLFLFPFVIYGFLVFSDLRIQQAIIRQRWMALILALVLILVSPVITCLLEGDPSYPVYALGILLVGVLMWSCLLAVSPSPGQGSAGATPVATTVAVCVP